MASPGQALENPRIGQRASFIETAADNGGERLLMEFTHQAGNGVGDHFHVRQSERFEVLAGEIDLKVGGERRRLATGDSLTVPPGAVHSFEVVGSEPARILGEFRPAGSTAEVFMGTFATDARYERTGSRLLRLVDAARVARSAGPDFFWLPRWPWRLQAAVLRAVARLADLARAP